jgi:hypothetical protein
MRSLEEILDSKWREYALVLLFFFLAAVIFTWPLLLHVHNGVLGGHGDPLLNTWILSWNAKTLFSQPGQLYQGNIIYPSRDVGAYSEIMLTLSVMAAPVIWIFRNPILAYNFLVFFGFVFSAFGCYLLIKELTGSRWGGLAGGLFFAFSPFKISQLSHLQIMFTAFLPFMLLYLFRYLRRGGKKNLVLFALFFLLQSLVSWHYLIFCCLAVALLWVWTAIFTRSAKEWRRLAWVVAASAVVVLLMIPLALPYLRLHDRLPGFERTLFETQLYSARPSDYLRVLPYSPIYGDAPFPFQPGDLGSEFILYPGLAVLVLAVAGIALRRRRRSDPAVFDLYSFRQGALYFLILAALSFILSFGPSMGGVTNILYKIPYNLGVFRFIRVPTRFYILFSLGLAVLAGYGTAKLAVRLDGRLLRRGAENGGDQGKKGIAGLAGKWRFGRTSALALVLILALEIACFNQVVFDKLPIYGNIPSVYKWLKEQGDVRVIELPTDPLDSGWRYDREMEIIPENVLSYFSHEGIIMYLSTYHWKKIVNGYSGYEPYWYRRIITEMQGFPSRRTVDLLQGLGVDYVIWHWGWVPGDRAEEYKERLEGTPGLSRVGDFDADSVYEVHPEETAPASELDAVAVSPRVVRPRSSYDLGILVTNRSEEPLVLHEEEPQQIKLSYLDESGNLLHEERGSYRAPFFLEPGESQCLPYRTLDSPEEGSYQLHIFLEGGVLGEREFVFPLTVEDIPTSLDPGVMEGAVYYQGEGAVRLPSSDGLFPLLLAVENTGDTLWEAAKWNRQEELVDPGGVVRVGAIWFQGEEKVWQEQRCSLPCGVSPGQAVDLPTMLRAPATPGRYRLLLRLVHEEGDWFGEIAEIEVDVE